MIASGTIIIDGQTYRKGDIIHDLGGWDCIDTDGSDITGGSLPK